jgi:Mn-dependent DtxR family transcriptional regulator
MKVHRCIKALLKAKLIKATRAGYYKLTPEGEKERNEEANE